MKPLTLTRTRLVAAFAIFLLAFAAYVAYGQTTGPAINIQLADPAGFSKILPLGDTVGPANYYKGRKMIMFRAELTSTQKNILFAAISVPRASASMYCIPPTNHTFIGGGWDVSQVADGTEATVTVIALDNAGHTSMATRTVTLRK